MIWILVLSIVVISAIVYITIYNSDDFSPEQYYYKTTNGLYFSIKLTEPEHIKEVALKRACGLLGVSLTSVREINASEYSLSGETIAKIRL